MSKRNYRFVCMEHEEDMELTEGKYNFYLLCPMYYYENRGTPNACTNRLSLAASNLIRDEIELLDAQDQLVEGYTAETARYAYKVNKIKENEIVVGIRTKEGGKRINAGYL